MTYRIFFVFLLIVPFLLSPSQNEVSEHVVNQQVGARVRSDFATFPSSTFIKVTLHTHFHEIPDSVLVSPDSLSFYFQSKVKHTTPLKPNQNLTKLVQYPHWNSTKPLQNLHSKAQITSTSSFIFGSSTFSGHETRMFRRL